MNKFLLSVHVLTAIVAIGPVTVAASMFPPAARAALASPGDAHAVGVSRVLYRICGIYSAVGLLVVLFGFLTAQSLGVLGEGWLMAAIALTALAALVLAFAVLPAQRDLMDEITAASVSSVSSVSSGGSIGGNPAGGEPAGAGMAAERPAGGEAAGAATLEAAPLDGETAGVGAPADGVAAAAGGVARSRRLAMSVGIFNLLWVAVTVLMIIRPGSTTNV
ncbi:protease [Frankia sp. R82]|uniref:protease n=1 Tax=Frankia sp. R82 TaxID=2950553 RepID=UPI0020444BA1|nr:protease [Frankia sp. R82]MCM3884321.1 protease [Frankia sp. R82]